MTTWSEHSSVSRCQVPLPNVDATCIIVVGRGKIELPTERL